MSHAIVTPTFHFLIIYAMGQIRIQKNILRLLPTSLNLLPCTLSSQEEYLGTIVA